MVHLCVKAVLLGSLHGEWGVVPTNIQLFTLISIRIRIGYDGLATKVF